MKIIKKSQYQTIMNVPLILCTILLSYLIKVITCENLHGEEKWLIYVPAQAYAFGLYSVQRNPGKRLCWCLDSRACCCCQHKMEGPPVVACTICLVSIMNYTWWHPPDIPMPYTSSLPCQGVWLMLKCKMPQDSLNIRLSGTQHREGEDAPWGEIWPMEDSY